jgi:hypothetical protein
MFIYFFLKFFIFYLGIRSEFLDENKKFLQQDCQSTQVAQQRGVQSFRQDCRQSYQGGGNSDATFYLTTVSGI